MAKEYIWVDGSGREYQVSGPASASFEAGYLDKCMREHKTAQTLDHADGSVTEEKLAEDAVTDKKIGTRTVQDPRDDAGAITGWLTPLLECITQAIRAQRANTVKALDKKADKENGYSGFTGGEEADARTGGAIGIYACTVSGGAVGNSAKADSGGAVGHVANATYGGAVGHGARAENGGAVGQSAESTGGGAVGLKASTKGGGAVGGGAVSGNGFAGGFVAKTVNASGNVIDAIQLGTGTNTHEKTLQIYDYQLLDADGNIPAERLANATKERRSVTVTLQASAWSDGVQTMAVSGLAAAGNGIISVSPGATAVQRAAARSAMLSVTGQAAGELTIAADGTVPEIDIPVVVILLG